MIRKVATLLVTLVVLSLGQMPLSYAAAKGPVIVIHINGEIDQGQVALVNRALSGAKEKGAGTVLVEIDTFGGLVDSAVKIRDMISDSSLDTICYIKNRAWSAGALIALAHKHIAIAPGGSIGAAEPIPATEKTVAALKAEFAATANKTGRNPLVAEAMVDKSLGFPGYAKPGEILALTDYQAVQLSYADLVASDRNTVLSHYGLDKTEQVEYREELADKMAGWFSNPVIKTILLAVIFFTFFAEVKTAGTGVAAMAGLVAMLILFASQWMTGVGGWLEILLFLGGFLLISVELFVPGFGFFGVAGAGCILVSIFLILGGNQAALAILLAGFVIALIAFLLLLKKLPSSRLWKSLVLKDSETTGAGFVSGQNYEAYLGKTGVAVTLLRPAGTVDIEGFYFDAVSEGKYIEPGSRIKVVNVTGNKIVVRLVESNQ
ncbi:NfeD family protein [Lucifera butyrica]|nr:NfeD family protein [Lucifera butyrica]